MKGRQVMLLMGNTPGKTKAKLYEFDIRSENPTYWYLQSLNLTTPSNSSTFSSFQSDYFLAITQTSLDSVLVYKYVDNHFIPHDIITSPEVTSVTSFEIGFKSFLAVDGHQAGIYEFSANGLVERQIVNSHPNGIHYWLPIPLQTYRDDVILFAQRALDHGSHGSYAVEIITYNGGQFEEHEDIPCSLFEEESSWLSCLAHDNGIMGASYITVGDKLGLIVPKPSNSSLVLFMVHSGIESMPNPKEEEIDLLYELKENLQELIDEQYKEYEELMNFNPIRARDTTDAAKVEEKILGGPHEEDVTSYKEEVEAFGADIHRAMEKMEGVREKENRTHFDTIKVNGVLRIRGNLDVSRVEIDRLNGLPATKLLKDIVKKDEVHKILKKKTFTDLSVENIDFEVVNGINASDIMYKNDPEIKLTGNLTFEDIVNLNETFVTTGLINDIDLEKEAIKIEEGYDGPLEFEEIIVLDKMKAKKINNQSLQPFKPTSSEDGDNETKTIFIPHNVSVTSINGIKFNEFIEHLCLVNVKCYIPGNITLVGNVVVKEMHTNFLNDLKFPEDFMFADHVFHANITGQKTFMGSLTARDIRSQGTIGGVDTNKLVTLSTDQIIPSKLTFENLKLTEELNVTGKILGEFVGKFVPNPTLDTTGFIKSNVDFKNLEVEGNIILENNFNGENFEKLLNDLVYLDEDIANITGAKMFSKGLAVLRNLEIDSKSINTVNLESFVTKDTDQNLHISLLKGDITIGSLKVEGRYDGVDIAEFDESLVKLTGEQFISSTLIFTEHVDVGNLEITGKLNELEASEYLYTSGHGEIPKNVTFEDIVVENLLVEGDFTGKWSDVDLLNVTKRYLSFTKNQTIDVDFHIKESTVDRLDARKINGLNYGDLFDESRFLDTVKEMLNNGSSKVGNLKVDGSLHLITVNNKSIEEILPRSPLRNEDGTLKKELIFENDVYFDQLHIKELSSVGWEDFVSHLVFKNETSLVMSGTKIFRSGFKVEKLIETKKINDILLKDILTKEGAQQIKGPVVMTGAVTFENPTVLESINGTLIDDILDVLKVSNGTRIFKGDMVFKRLAHIRSLIVNGTVNNEFPEEVLKSIVYKNADAVLKSKIIFRKPVNISGNLAIHVLNRIDVLDIESKIVLTTTDADISGVVSFSKPIIIQDHMEIDKDLNTRLLFGVDTDEWLDRAVFLDKGLLVGNYSFEHIAVNEELVTEFINNINMSRIVPLRSNQSIGFMKFDEVSCVNDISVGNLVNGFKLSPAFENL
ncbi:hypothetical protein JTB14_017725 [Gonioctena quinquepunctata]|nr:hypothetical protein JTB14_017725 [Gonioctena quinquepunctata]